MNRFIFFAAVLFLVCVIPSHAAGPGDEVIVVYNTRVPESKAVAEHYAKRRGVPSEQIFGFALSTGDDMSRVEFRDALQRPLAKALDQKKLWKIRSEVFLPTNGQPGRVEWKVAESKIRYAVLCYGVPLRISKDPNLKEPAAENLRPELRRNEAAVDTELALLPQIEQNLMLAGPSPNPVYTTTNAATLHPTNGVLMVTRLDGPSAEIARGLVDKAIQAETDGLWGRGYFDLRNTTDPNLKQGEDWIRGAAEISRHLGFETVVEETGSLFPAEFPLSHVAIYCGWYSEHVHGAFAQPEVEFMPGAFAYHLHSFSGSNLRSTTRNWVGALLAKGATASMGSVDEPYLGGTPDVAVFLARWLFHSMTFGEAAYAGQNILSWQTTIIGDPLYRPFGKPPQQIHQELERRESKLVEWSHLRVVNLNVVRNSPVAELVNYLEQIDLTKRSAVLSEKLGELYAAQGKPSSSLHAFEQALALDPSPQQRVRLTLATGDKLIAAERHADALELYERFLQALPDYPDQLGIYKKLQSLAQKMGRTVEATNYENRVKLLSPTKP
jgi:uncharacterized protein (TIGR03790 family)